MKIEFKKIKRISVALCLILIVCLVLIFKVFSPKTSDILDTSKEFSDFEKNIVSASESVTVGNLTISMDEMGHFSLCNNVDGKVWYSIPQDSENDTISKGLTRTDIRSELIIEYLSRENENSTETTEKNNSYVMCESNGEIKVSKIDNGFKVLYDFAELEIKIPVEYIINNGTLEASVDVERIDEGDKNYLVTLEFLPYFGAAGPNTEGYLFVPDGSGAVAKFNQNIKPLKSYEKRIYGDDSSHSDEAKITEETYIKLPVFGIVNGDAALMGVVTNGDAASSILAETGSDTTYYNIINSKMIYRIFAKDTAIYQEKNKSYVYSLTHTDFGSQKYTVKYFTLSGENASYSGMANVYKNYLVDNYSLKKNIKNKGLALRVYGAIEEKKNFFGVSYYKAKSLTTYNQLQAILSELKSEGVVNISVQYQGWQGNGITNRQLPIAAKPLSILGGKKQLNSLLDFSENNNIELLLDTDLLTFKEGGNGVSVRKNATKAPNGDTAKKFDYSIVTYAKNVKSNCNYLLGMNNIEKHLTKFIKNYNKLDTSSVSFSSFGNNLYSDFNVTNGSYRNKSILYMQKALATVSKEFKTVAVTGGNAYSIPYIDRVYDAPVESSGYEIFSYDVPFYQMVLSGYVSYTTPSVMQSVDYDTMLLKAIETGSDLLFNCIYEDSSVLRDTDFASDYSSGYDIWKENAVTAYSELEKLNSKTENSYMTAHTQIFDGVYKIAYSNGALVYVNYNETAISVDDVKIEGKSWEVKEKVK